MISLIPRPSRLLAGIFLLAVALGLGAGAARANTISTYTLNNVTLFGGGTVTGWFTYDDRLHTVTGADIRTAGNASGVEPNVFKYFETVIHYAGGDQVIIANSPAHVEHIVFAGAGLQLGEAGTFAIGTSGQIGSYIYQVTPTVYGTITGGTITGVNSVPETATSAGLLSVGFIGLVALRRRLVPARG